MLKITRHITDQNRLIHIDKHLYTQIFSLFNQFPLYLLDMSIFLNIFKKNLPNKISEFFKVLQCIL